MKVIYFIQSHKNPDQVYRLVKAIKKSSCHALVLISHNFSCSILDINKLKQYSGLEVIKRNQSARRGDCSILEIYLEAIDWVLEHNYDFDWLVCLSGQDYPVRPIPEIEAFLATTEYDGFIKYWDLLSEDNPWGKEGGEKRYFAKYIRLPDWSKWWLRKLTRIEPLIPLLNIQWRYALIGLRMKVTPFNKDFKCYGGWYWNTLSKKCIEFLSNYLKEYPELLKFYRRTLAPEESIIPTVLVNSNQFNLYNDCLRYLSFPPELFGYAQCLTINDYDKITSGYFHFARKFDSKTDNKIIDLLDQLL
ncbi:beta-1,6-N-acetylglucosaminyltransferase [Pleurocapsa sp. PCC 7319]|uniref:beta-1,6-N-acetylglucosaminyltransferase n=1 Tax=Pleurocapsa sp. PCC 7319 TaxID=118161 RepID=UPI00034B0B79|nr:beta-1,6-N-acetylglucosaminyltransferase [Pleurocapsa sp. PCC 7319]